MTAVPSPSPPPAASNPRPSRRDLEKTKAKLSDRDWSILFDLDHLRLLSADQLERLHFARLAGRSREVVRGRTLRRLVAWGLITALERRVGGARRGSARTVYALDTAGQRLVGERHAVDLPSRRSRRPGQPGERFQAHILAVSELYVSLASDAGVPAAGVRLTSFDAEPAAWWPNGLGGWLKPDAYVQLTNDTFVDHWWVEVDQATESLPTIQRKLSAYLDFYRRGQLGPGDVMPRVLISAISQPRAESIHENIARLPEPADQLFRVSVHGNALRALLASFTE
jgi:Replication-relaxation